MRGFLLGLFAAAAVSGAAHANTITVNGNSATLTCNGAAIGACQAFSGGGGSPSTNPTTTGVLGSVADRFNGTPANLGASLARLNTLAGTSFSTGTESGSNPNPSFTTLSEYVILKIGQWQIFIKNTSGGALTINYTSGQASGLSGYDLVGANVVPLPGAAWLMIAGVAGLIGAQRRKKDVA